MKVHEYIASFPLSKKERVFIDYLISEISTFGRMPSVRDTAAFLGIHSPAGAMRLFERAANRGLLSKDSKDRWHFHGIRWKPIVNMNIAETLI